MRKCPFLRFVPKTSSPSGGGSSGGKKKKMRRGSQETTQAIDSNKDGAKDSKSSNLSRRRQPSRSTETSSASVTSAVPSQMNSAPNSASLLPENRPKSPVYYRLPASLIQVPADSEDPFGEGIHEESDRRSPLSLSPLGSKRSRLADGFPVPTLFAGHPVPFKRYGVCSVCGMDEESRNDTIVLCDGPGCGQEFHMQCCRPALMSVPEGDFYCFDCSANGSSDSLKAYFEEMEGARDAYSDSNGDNRKLSFVDYLIRKDMKDHQYNNFVPTEQSDCEEEKLKRILNAARPPCSELDGLHMNSSALIGKAILLHCPKSNDYHTGRILKAKKVFDNEEASDRAAVDSECLVRFPAGRDNRKSTLTQWMRLEEHSLAISTELVWAVHTILEGGFDVQQQQQWLPSKLWLRSSRELVMSMHMLQESLDQIRFRDWRYQNETVQGPVKRTPPTWILGELLGRGNFKLLNVGTQTRRNTNLSPPNEKITNGSELTSLAMREQTCSADINKNNDTRLYDERLAQVMSALEHAEREEQDRVHNWNKVPLLNSQHRRALASQDESMLVPLACTERNSLIRPSPLVRTGLDRIYVLNQVASTWQEESRRTGEIHVECRTKDVALSLSSTLFEPGSITGCIQSLNRKERGR